MTQWYRRLAEVPGLDYPGSPGVNRTRLPGHNAKPDSRIYDWEGQQRTQLYWTYGGMTTTASPAQQWHTDPKPGESPGQTVLRRIREALELPGTLSDYHFIVAGGYDGLMEWKVRRVELWVYPEVEKLCWLDIKLVETYPDTVRSENSPPGQYYSVRAFTTLAHLYSQEGFLREARDVARRGARFGVPEATLESLNARLERLEAEEISRASA